MEEIQENYKLVYTTEVGRIIRLRPVSQRLIDKAQRSVKIPRPPRYHIVTDVVDEWHDFDDVSIEGQHSTPEDKEAWRQYKLDLAELKSERTERLLRVLFIKGTVREDVAGDEWEAEQRACGIDDVPSDPIERWYYYLVTELLLTLQDFTGLMLAIIKLSGIDEARLAEAEAIFRRSMGRSAGTDAGAVGGESGEQTGAVVAQQDIS